MSAPDDVPLAKRLLDGRGGEVLVTPAEMHYLNGLTDWDLEKMVAEAAVSFDVVLFPLPKGTTTRVRVVRP